jgi:hypothetical protein
MLLQAEARWRQELATGSLLDCLDSTGTWLNAEVLASRDSVPAPFILAGAPSPLHSTSSFAAPDVLPADLMDTGTTAAGAPTAATATAAAYAVTGTAAGQRTAEHYADASDEPPPLVQCDSPMWDSSWAGIDAGAAAAQSAAKSAPRVTVQSVVGDAPLQPMNIQIEEVLEAEELTGTGFAATAGTVREVLVAFHRRATAGVTAAAAAAAAVETAQPAPELSISTDDSSSDVGVSASGSDIAAVHSGWPVAAATAAGEADCEWVAVDSHRLQLLHSCCYASNAQLPEEPVNDAADGSNSALSGEQCLTHVAASSCICSPSVIWLKREQTCVMIRFVIMQYWCNRCSPLIATTGR